MIIIFDLFDGVYTSIIVLMSEFKVVNDVSDSNRIQTRLSKFSLKNVFRNSAFPLPLMVNSPLGNGNFPLVAEIVKKTGKIRRIFSVADKLNDSVQSKYGTYPSASFSGRLVTSITIFDIWNLICNSFFYYNSTNV